jgi:hypothetical protein
LVYTLSFYTLDFFKANIHPIKKATAKINSPARDSHGNGRSNSVARKSSAECVKGKKYNTVLAMLGSWFSEKNVPHRKVIGRITTVLKLLIPWWDLITKATSTPNRANVKHDSINSKKNNGLISIVGARIKPTAYMAVALMKPLTTPIRALPMIMA